MSQNISKVTKVPFSCLREFNSILCLGKAFSEIKVENQKTFIYLKTNISR